LGNYYREQADKSYVQTFQAFEKTYLYEPKKTLKPTSHMSLKLLLSTYPVPNLITSFRTVVTQVPNP
jgi:hypothetical protein